MILIYNIYTYIFMDLYTRIPDGSGTLTRGDNQPDPDSGIS